MLFYLSDYIETMMNTNIHRLILFPPVQTIWILQSLNRKTRFLRELCLVGYEALCMFPDTIYYRNILDGIELAVNRKQLLHVSNTNKLWEIHQLIAHWGNLHSLTRMQYLPHIAHCYSGCCVFRELLFLVFSLLVRGQNIFGTLGRHFFTGSKGVIIFRGQRGAQVLSKGGNKISFACSCLTTSIW